MPQRCHVSRVHLCRIIPCSSIVTIVRRGHRVIGHTGHCGHKTSSGPAPAHCQTNDQNIDDSNFNFSKMILQPCHQPSSSAAYHSTQKHIRHHLGYCRKLAQNLLACCLLIVVSRLSLLSLLSNLPLFCVHQVTAAFNYSLTRAPPQQR